MKFLPLDQASFAANLASALDNRELSCYAIVDQAQDGTLLARFEKEQISMHSKCLLPAALGSDTEAYAPQLVALSPLAADTEAWPDIVQGAASHPASFTLLASTDDFDTLWESLAAFTEILLPDGTDMIFAFWDPAILGTLTGQKSDLTLHVGVQALTVSQRERLLQGIVAWWYWDRDGHPQQVLPGENDNGLAPHRVTLPLKLAQVQVDMLVEAGMPDQLLSMLQENQPQLLMDIPPAQHYRLVQKHLLAARKLKLSGMRDILNYTCAALIYGDKLQTNPAIASLLAQVKAGDISFEAAMDQFP
ncbi:DUF4123 domain-containing protein [Janthinobacterium sp. BJB446]|uniref:DUF4123 domain-containing protein n=1 Tax=Janthinobacterium sp. BJB446 TaxID=2048009 RepID=UPI0015D4B550|nr:DUF4123 domain-containing protein [Janthinobacterium sp. BJB446]